MKLWIARVLLTTSLLCALVSTLCLFRRAEPFHTFYFLFIWWSYIGILDAWLYLKGGESLFIERMGDFTLFLVPLSALLWFMFEAFNLRLANWAYIGVPQTLWIRWTGNFLAFATVLPGLFLTANLLDYYGVLRKNEFSQFFSEPLPGSLHKLSVAAGVVMLVLPLAFPRFFFPLVWGGFLFLLDPVNAAWGGKSLIQEWRQKNWNRTLQLLAAGFVCGGLWEFWNFWAGAKWIYSVPLPEAFLKDLKIFEMPVLGFLGFPVFALECFALTEFARGLRERLSPALWRALAAAAFLFCLAMCHFMDIHTVKGFRP